MIDFEWLLNMELGSGIIAAANSQDERNAVVRFLGNPKPDDAKWIVNNIALLRTELLEEGFNLPMCKINDGNIKYNEVIIQYGIELYIFTVGDLNEIISFLRNKSYKYFRNIGTARYLVDVSRDAFDDIMNNQYQESYEKNKLIYFYSHPSSPYYNRLDKCDILHISSLNEIAGIKIKNNMLFEALQYLERAVILSNAPRIVDVSLKMQVYFNYAVLLLETGNVETAYSCFVTLFKLSRTSNYLLYYIYANMGIAQCFAKGGNFSAAVGYLQNIKNVLHPNNTNTHDLYIILSDEIILMQKRIIERNEMRIIDLENRIQYIKNQRNQLLLQFTNSVLKFATSIVLKGLPGMKFVFGNLNSIENSIINNSGSFKMENN
jgi:tetratricopeptide (TPR) repeat protein